VYEAQSAQFPHLAFVDRGLEAEVEMVKGFGWFTLEQPAMKVAPHILHTLLNLALGLGKVRPAEPAVKPSTERSPER
jgi:hypothetical protein